MAMGQKEAILMKVREMLGSSFDAKRPARDQLTDNQVNDIKSFITDGIMAGSISYSKSASDSQEVYKYVSAMMSNHFRKSAELNGGTAYKATIVKDEQLTELGKLLTKVKSGTPEYEQILSAINDRKSQIKDDKITKKLIKQVKTINLDNMPSDVKELAESIINQFS